MGGGKIHDAQAIDQQFKPHSCKLHIIVFVAIILHICELIFSVILLN